jgi:hypothetical protein
MYNIWKNPGLPKEEISLETLAKIPDHVSVTSHFATYEELFKASSPIKLFEYLASGLPILATRMACHSDVISIGKYVFWVERIDLSTFLTILQQI